ncbi:hypothetical protein [Bradyrhizobium prioriisuperbiae]|uniref:hypothetical protein n=1 Tax=Bradyrhizobium prioriisuperbiae TaxID=2854389 RepID=UPI0028EA33AE|nr:hypothetical protein [Bradyrhizobium prioritasuperba]
MHCHRNTDEPHQGFAGSDWESGIESELNQLVQAMATHSVSDTGFLAIAAANAAKPPVPAVIAPSWH